MKKIGKGCAICWYGVVILMVIANAISAEDDTLTPQDLAIKQIALECRIKIADQLEKLVAHQELTMDQLFDTFYIPIPNTSPQKYHTQYDRYTDIYLQHILDETLYMDDNISFVVAVDLNGYLPTHNLRYSKPLTGDSDVDTRDNRTKRLFNDRTGLAAARNEKEFLIQKYNRDTGESMADLSIPIYIDNRHWGALRIGYSRVE